MASPVIAATAATPADATSQRAGARRSPVPIDWVRSDLPRDAAPPPWAYDGLMVFSTDSGLPWYVGDLPARWLARYQGLALTTINLNISADVARLQGIPSDTSFYFDSLVNLMVPAARSVIRESGGRFLVSCDDEFWTLPPWIPGGARRADLIQRVERSLTEADHVVVFSARMAERVQRFNRSIRVLPLALPPLAQLPTPAPRGARKGIRIGWVGSQSHRGDLEMIGPAVLQLLAQRPDVTFVLAGQCCEIVPWAWALRDSAQLELHSGHVLLPAYYRWIASLDLDGFVTPLVEHPFNSVKPCLKPLEAAGLGIPVIASMVGAYAEELRHDETALLVANTTEAWLAALLRLVDDADLRTHLSAGGRAWAATRTIEQTGPLWAELWGA
jgi:glycosyltransferase involved in cell wall biosynthesis